MKPFRRKTLDKEKKVNSTYYDMFIYNICYNSHLKPKMAS